MYRILFLLVSTILFVVPLDASAVELIRDVDYKGGTKIEMFDISTSFVIPKGWHGSANGEFFSMTRVGAQSTIIIQTDTSTMAQVKAEMAQPIDLGDGMIAQLHGKLNVRKDRASGDFTISNAPVGAHIISIVGSSGVQVNILAIATEAEFAAFKKAAIQVANTVKITKPKKAKVVAGSTKGYWGKVLKGKRLLHYFTTSGYSEKQTITLCPNGRFFYGMVGGGSDTMAGFSAAMQSSNGGTWNSSGNEKAGKFNMNFNDGRVWAYDIWWDGDQLMLDRGKWFITSVSCD